MASEAGKGSRRKAEFGSGEWFEMGNGSSCLIALHRGDITKWHVNGLNDAIVNAANDLMLGGGGVDGAIHRAAGPELLEVCRQLPLKSRFVRCPTGEAIITKGFCLPVSCIIHTVGPIYTGEETSAPLLEKAYKSSLELAAENHIKFVAFPAISCGIYGYPFKEGAQVALRTVQTNSNNLEEVHFVHFESGTWDAWLDYAELHFKKVQ